MSKTAKPIPPTGMEYLDRNTPYWYGVLMS